VLNIHDKTAFAGPFQDKFTNGDHLPEGLPRAVSEEYFQFAQFLVDTLPDTPDLGSALGSGQERVHTTCECRCGATAKRPEPPQPEDLGSIGRATVRVDEHGMGKVMVGLTDVSHLVSGGRGHVDGETEKALEALGWTPPHEGDPLRKIADALGNHAPSEIKWSTVIDVVRGLRETVELEYGS